MVYAFVIYPLAALIAAVIADRLALAKNRNRVVWMSASLLFPPFVLPLFFLKKRPWHKRPRYETEEDDLRDFLRD